MDNNCCSPIQGFRSKKTVAKFLELANLGDAFPGYPMNVIDINAQTTEGLVDETAPPTAVM